MSQLLRATVMLGALFLSAGCASFDMIKQPPVLKQPISIAYSEEGPSGWTDLPVGAYRVPKTNVIISGHQSSAIGAAGLFGVVGILAADAVEAGVGASRVKDSETALHIDLTQQATLDTRTIVAADRFRQSFTLAASNGPTLVVTPFTVITFVDDKDVQPYVILKIRLWNGQSAGGSWTTRYISTVGKPAPLVGENSFTSNGGELLKTTLNSELERAISAMLNDVVNRPPRDDKNLVTIETGVPYQQQPLVLTGYKIAEDANSVVFAPQIADMSIVAGIFVLDKSVTVYRDAKAND
jgi:hypothetical protein